MEKKRDNPEVNWFLKHNEIMGRLFQKRKGFEKKFQKFEEFFLNLYETVPEFKKVVDIELPDDGNYHEVLEIVAYDSINKREVIWDKIAKDERVRPLLSYLMNLHFDYGRVIWIRWLEFGKRLHITHGPDPIPPIHQYYVIKDGKMEYKPRIDNFQIVNADETEWTFNIMTVDDKTEYPAFTPLQDLLRTADCMADGCPVPTIIKYSRGNKKMLLLFLPELLNVTTLKENYMKGLSHIHGEFYQVKSKGRPESKYNQSKRILQALTEYRGRKLSIEELSDLGSKKLAEAGEDMTASTIRRHYRNELRAIKGDKK